MSKTSIEWTDVTWNPTRGCAKVSPGCAHCYAETFAERWRGIPGHPYEQGFDLRLVPEKLAEPLSWKKPRRVFVNSMSDLFHESVPNEYIAAVFGVMAATPRHTYQVLTKRSKRMREWFEWARCYRGGCFDEGPYQAMWEATSDGDGPSQGYAWHPDYDGEDGLPISHDWPLPNVWLGASCENQKAADERIPDLLITPTAVRFISAEPLLGPVNLRDTGRTECHDCRNSIATEAHGQLAPRIDWVICGGESGPKARPMHPDWVRSLRDQCVAAKVPFFFKQWGGTQKKKAGRILDGRQWDEFPEVTP